MRGTKYLLIIKSTFMKTRHLLMSLIALMAILITSCSEQQSGTGMEAGGTKTLTFRLTTDGQAQ